MQKTLSIQARQRLIRVAKGEEKADLVLRGATWLNVFTERWCYGDIAIAEGVIAGMGDYKGYVERHVEGTRVVPGFIDGHIHLESTLLSPSKFTECVLPYGTTAVVCDPHEIANVMGVDGITYMLQATEGLPLDVFFALPSCVPATDEDESFATLTAADLEPLISHPRVVALAEIMNYPGLLGGSEAVMAKLEMAQKYGLCIDGHAPLVTGADLQAYVAAGVGSDHECTNCTEAMEKLSNGQWLMIREGTAAQNLSALLPLLKPPFSARCLFVTDDKHPAELKKDGHIDGLMRMAIRQGVDPIVAIKVASWNAAQAFGLRQRGAIAPGYAADMVLLNEDYEVQQTIKDGQIVYSGSAPTVHAPVIDEKLSDIALHSFRLDAVDASRFDTDAPLGLLRMVNGQILTENGGMANGVEPDKDILKIAVLERHHKTGHVGIGYLSGYGLKRGAIATSVAHDSHNLIVIGTNDEDMACAAERVRQLNGGIVLADGGKVVGELPLPIAGLMTDLSADDVDAQLIKLKALAADMGVNPGVDPFMTLSFMSLPVIPAMRVLTHGVFDVTKWAYVSRS